MRKLTILFAAALLCGCHNTLTLTQEESGKTVILSAGETAAIQLPENPTTGYSWEFFPEPENQNVIGNIKEEYTQDKAEAGMVGVGGTKTYSFVAKQSGNITIKGYYYRPWENKDTGSAATVSYKIEVH
ncbi:MAG: protease inhibitor I42 family protein [Alphaproteobacteria bacterium]|nr:protease inhibitor I42 family protein [Alphaproteobacteria bacterium]MDY4689226.1 protease inhibitor I42 family protein [Alphaproteobacteria bacterium]